MNAKRLCLKYKTDSYWDMTFMNDDKLTNSEWAYRRQLAGIKCSAIARALNSTDPRANNCLTKDKVRHGIKKFTDNQDNNLVNDESVSKEESVERVDVLLAQDRQLTLLNQEIARINLKKTQFSVSMTDALSLLVPIALPEPFIEPTLESVTDEEAILHVTDIHFGEVVNPKRVSGLGEFSMNICFARMDYLAERVAKELLQRSMMGKPITRLTVLVGGDLVHNDTMRVVAKALAETNLINQLAIGSRMLELFLLKMAHIVPYVKAIFVPGNHGRIGEKETEPLMNNYDSHIAYIIRDMLFCRGVLDSRIFVEVAESLYATFDVAGWRCCLDHGHMVRSSDGSNPTGGAKTRVEGIIKSEMRRCGVAPSFFFLGHNHTQSSLSIGGGSPGGSHSMPRGQIFTSDSVIGIGEYGANRCLTGDASQMLYYVNCVEGVVDNTKIYLDQIRGAEAADQLYKYESSKDLADALYEFERINVGS